MTIKRQKKNYINNKDLFEALVKYKSDCKEAENSGEERPMVPKYIGESIYQIATRLSTKPNFSGYTFKEDMVMDGIENCLQYMHNFDPEKTQNPFAYFTQIIWYAFLRRIAKEKKQMYVKYKATEQFGILDSGEMYEDSDGNMKQFVLYDNISDFIQTFEDKLKVKKKSSKAKNLDKFFDEELIELPIEPIELDDGDLNESGI